MTKCRSTAQDKQHNPEVLKQLCKHIHGIYVNKKKEMLESYTRLAESSFLQMFSLIKPNNYMRLNQTADNAEDQHLLSLIENANSFSDLLNLIDLLCVKINVVNAERIPEISALTSPRIMTYFALIDLVSEVAHLKYPEEYSKTHLKPVGITGLSYEHQDMIRMIRSSKEETTPLNTNLDFTRFFLMHELNQTLTASIDMALKDDLTSANDTSKYNFSVRP